MSISIITLMIPSIEHGGIYTVRLPGIHRWGGPSQIRKIRLLPPSDLKFNTVPNVLARRFKMAQYGKIMPCHRKDAPTAHAI